MVHEQLEIQDSLSALGVVHPVHAHDVIVHCDGADVLRCDEDVLFAVCGCFDLWGTGWVRWGCEV